MPPPPPKKNTRAAQELHEEAHPFSTTELAQLAAFLNRLAFRLTWELGDDGAPLPVAASSVGSAAAVGAPTAGAASNLQRKGVREATIQLLGLLADRDARRSFCSPDLWLIAELRYSELHREFFEGKSRARRLLASMPWAVPFERRINIFRELVAHEKDALPNEALPEHQRGYHIKIRREHLLEDGYIQVSPPREPAG